MRKYQKIAKEVGRKLSKIDGISKILLYGSVARGEQRKDSDIDIAIILDETLKLFLVDQIEGFPLYKMSEIKKMTSQIGERYGVNIEINPIWENEYRKGKKLFGNKYRRNDLLNEVGTSLYEAPSII